MSNKTNFVLAIAVLLVVSGCATTSTYRSNTDASASKISGLEAQLAEKDQELAKLRGQLGEQESALKDAQSDKRDLSEQLSKLQSAARQPKAEEAGLK